MIFKQNGLKNMNAKTFIMYTKLLDKRGMSICDGCSAEFHMSLFDILYPIFIITGISLFLAILLYWEEIKDKLNIR